MWSPDPAWQPLAGGGPGTEGLWSVRSGDRSWVVKRLRRPGAEEQLRLDPRHVGYWRREAEVALDPGYVTGPGVVPPAFGPLEEDDGGLTLWVEEVTGPPPSNLFVARALGRWAACCGPIPGWATRDLLGDRLGIAESNGGWPTLQRTALADAADLLWRRRGHWLRRLARIPLARMHGDAVPGNFLALRDDAVVAVDWQCFGTGPAGSDLGYYALSCREDFAVLLTAFLEGYAEQDGPADPEDIRLTAAVMACYTVFTRTERALAQAARGEGALAGKVRHPAVAPHLRALQRQLPQLEQLLLAGQVR